MYPNWVTSKGGTDFDFTLCVICWIFFTLKICSFFF